MRSSDAEELRAALLLAARNGEAVLRGSCEFGTRYIIDFEMVRGSFRATIRSSWIIRIDEQVPRLTTCYVL